MYSIEKAKPFLLAACFIGLVACNSSTKKEFSFSSDDLYVLKNIETTLFKVDSATRSKFVLVDSIQKEQLMPKGIIDMDPFGEQTEIVGFTEVHFVSKQDKIGDLQPIIVSSFGDDYAALIMILLDKNNTPISHTILSGGISAGPDDELGDSIYINHNMESLIKGDEIITYVLRVRQSQKDTAIASTIDSIICVRKILPDGTMKTIKTDSVRYKEKYYFPRHCW